MFRLPFPCLKEYLTFEVHHSITVPLHPGSSLTFLNMSRPFGKLIDARQIEHYCHVNMQIFVNLIMQEKCLVTIQNNFMHGGKLNKTE